MLTPDSPPGWYGKLPVLGDFAQRRLPQDFVEAWDAWLAKGLGDWQAADDAWLERYLSGPSWRFVLTPNVIGPQAWAGVLMPSCDRVGRYFPLCIAQLLQLPVSDTGAQSLLDWLLRLDDLAVDALHEDWAVEQLEAELARTSLQAGERAGALAEQVLQLAPGQTLWICHGVQGEPIVRRHQGLPPVVALFEPGESQSL
ncbi:MAG: type VI secretion system-associated protein TagF [Paucibacter sp.]|nr:type VI secretion system-associated protein TagF [Roseateles sp.]